jgi:NAD(P) transhydrogenase subunit beta
MKFLPASLVELAYLVTAVTFIIGIKRLGAPATARSGNQWAAAGMLLAIVATFFSQRFGNYLLIGGGIVVGGALGAVSARRVKITAMPQMVALFNGMGGGAAALIAAGQYRLLAAGGATVAPSATFTVLLSAVMGAISFSGSLIAFGKLQEWLSGHPLRYRAQHLVNGALLALVLALGLALLVVGTPALFAAYLVAAVLLGVLVVLPIGGADMPVVIALLNSCTGLAAAVTGFLLGNNVLVVAGALVGASGAILTQAMSRAMNRSVVNVLFGSFGTSAGSVAGSAGKMGAVHATTPEDVAVMLAYAREVIIVPGYGLAVARAQHAVKELADLLEQRGVEVKYAIHPVAGRMPGHMNVLLAEADVPYSELYTMEQINPEFPHADVALVVGANDITNPAARSSNGSPISGMPILDVDAAAAVVVLKRSMGAGFAGIDNELYVNPKTRMLFGDARASLGQLVAAVKQV